MHRLQLLAEASEASTHIASATRGSLMTLCFVSWPIMSALSRPCERHDMLVSRGANASTEANRAAMFKRARAAGTLGERMRIQLHKTLRENIGLFTSVQCFCYEQLLCFLAPGAPLVDGEDSRTRTLDAGN